MLPRIIESFYYVSFLEEKTAVFSFVVGRTKGT